MICIKPNLKGIKFLILNWKLGIHLLFRTYYFGVNNKWWFNHRSIFGLPLSKRFAIKQIIESYKGMIFRITSCYFLETETQKNLGLWKD
jgi:hypothetical protein